MAGGQPDLAIVLVAAGASSRMGRDKIWAELANRRPLLAYSIDAARAARPAELVVVVAGGRQDDAARLAPAATVVCGGARRRDSVAAGVSACRAPWVAVHDAARPLAPASLFARGLAAARATGAAVPTVAVKDTIKRVCDRLVVETLPRAELVAVQTPQVFRRDLLERALAATDEDVTDEATLLERLGVLVAVFAGDERNVKVTTPMDLELVRLLLSSPQAAAESLPGRM